MKKNTTFIISVVAVAAVFFYAGMKVGQGKAPASPTVSQSGFQGGANGGGSGTRRAFSGGNGFTGGEILSKDASGITLKLANGGSQYVLVSGSTPVMKSATGTLQDLTAGENVTVTGSQNPDGSITAQSVQIRPAGIGGAGGARTRSGTAQ